MAKVMISLPDDLLGDIDREAARRGTSRSALLRLAVRRELGRPDREELDELFAIARAGLADAPPFDSGQAIREERDRLDERDRRRAGG